MKDYGYAWGWRAPHAGQEAAGRRLMKKGCAVYRLYGDNTEGLVRGCKGDRTIMLQRVVCFGIEQGRAGRPRWRRENYLKAAEMSTEDDYGMIDGIINNGPKEDKTAEVKAPERGEKSSIMDRLKAAKAETHQDKPTPRKERKNDRDL